MSLSQAEKDRFFEILCKMSISDAAEMKHRVEDELDIQFKISTARPEISPVVVAYGGPFDGRLGGTAPEPVYDIRLANPGTQRIAVMKLVRELLHLPLKESKNKIDKAPTTLIEGLNETEAEAIKERFEKVGASVDIEERYE